MENRRRSVRLEEKTARKVDEEVNRRRSLSPKRGRSAESPKTARQRRASLPASSTHKARTPAKRKERVLHVRKSVPNKSYHMTAYLNEKYKSKIWGCAFNQYKNQEEPQWLATLTNTVLRVYQFPVKEKTFKLLKESFLPKGGPDDEDFYTVAWCMGRGQESDKFKLVIAGETGRIFVLDFDSLRMEKALTGCGDMINDMRTHPVISTRIVAACKDMAVRVYDIRYETPLLICGAIDGHMDDVLSVDWGANGDCFYSAGYDHLVIMWDMKDPEVVKHLERATEALDRGEDPPNYSSTDSWNVDRRELRTWDPNDKALFVYKPKALVNSLHHDAIDCIRTFPSSMAGTDYIISKHCGEQPQAYLWRFGRTDPNAVENVPLNGWIRSHSTMMNYPIANGWIPFFMKFGIALSDKHRYLCIAGQYGEIQIFDIVTGDLIETVNGRGGLIRQIEFSQCGEFFATVSDRGHIARYDKVETVPPVVQETNRRAAKKKSTAESPDFVTTRRRSRRLTVSNDDTVVLTGPVTRRRSVSTRLDMDKKDDEETRPDPVSPLQEVEDELSEIPEPSSPTPEPPSSGYCSLSVHDYVLEDYEDVPDASDFGSEYADKTPEDPTAVKLVDESEDKENARSEEVLQERCFSPSSNIFDDLFDDEIIFSTFEQATEKKTSTDPSEMSTIHDAPEAAPKAIAAAPALLLTPTNKAPITYPDSVTRSGRRYSTTPEKDDEPARKIFHYSPKMSYCWDFPKKRRPKKQ